MKKLLALGLIILMALPANVLAAGEEAAIKQLQEQIQKLSAQLDALAKQVEANKVAAQSAQPAVAAPAAQASDEEVKELAKRLDKVQVERMKAAMAAVRGQLDELEGKLG